MSDKVKTQLGKFATAEKRKFKLRNRKKEETKAHALAEKRNADRALHREQSKHKRVAEYVQKLLRSRNSIVPSDVPIPPEEEINFLDKVLLRSRALQTANISPALLGKYYWVRGGDDLIALLRRLKLITDVDGFVHRLSYNDQYNISNTLAKHFYSIRAKLANKNKNQDTETHQRLKKELIKENDHNAVMSKKILKAMMSASYYGLLLNSKKELMAMVFVCSFRFEKRSFAYITLNLCKKDRPENIRHDEFMGDCIGRVQVSLEMQGFDIAGVSPEADYLNYYTNNARKPYIYTKGIASIIHNFKADGDLENTSFFRKLGDSEGKPKAKPSKNDSDDDDDDD